MALMAANGARQQTVASLQSYLTNQSNLDKYAEYRKRYQSLNTALNAKYAAAKSISDALATYPPGSQLPEYGDCRLQRGYRQRHAEQYDASTGILTFTSTGQNASTLNQFIKALTTTGIFYNVTYSGYNLSNDGTTYVVDVSCTLDGSAGR